MTKMETNQKRSVISFFSFFPLLFKPVLKQFGRFGAKINTFPECSDNTSLVTALQSAILEKKYKKTRTDWHLFNNTKVLTTVTAQAR